MVALEQFRTRAPPHPTRARVSRAAASTRCGAAEFMEDGLHGRLVEQPDDVEAFAAACCCLADRRVWCTTREAAIALGRSFDFGAHAACVREWLQT